MSVVTIFNIQLVLGYLPWLLGVGPYVWPRLKAMTRADAQRAIAVVHCFRFFGLVFLIPGIVGPDLPLDFAAFAAYGDFATGVLAMLALLTTSLRPLFWLFVAAINVVGTVDILVDYYHGVQLGVPMLAGEFGATYAILMLYVPLLLIAHVVAFYLLVRPLTETVRLRSSGAALGTLRSL